MIKPTAYIRFGLCFIFIASIWIGCKPSEPVDRAAPPVSVQVLTLKDTLLSEPVLGSGLLRSRNQIRMSFKNGGVIEKIYVKEGQKVKKGQKLAKLNLAEIEARTAQTINQRTQADIGISQAELALEKAERDFESAKALLKDSLIILDDYLNAETALGVAKEQLRFAKEQQGLANANRTIAEFNTQYSRIVAPKSGTILKRLAEPSELIGPGMPILILAPGKQDWVVASGLSEQQVVRIEEGDLAEIRFLAFPGQEFQGRVGQLPASIDPESGSFEVEIELTNPNNKLINGFLADCSIYPSSTEKAFLIPLEAIIDAQGREGSVYLLDSDSTVSQRTIRYDRITDRGAVVTESFKAGERIVVKGANYLAPGAKISIEQVK